MEEKRKIECDCGNVFEEKTVDINGIMSEAMICRGCSYETLTLKQVKKAQKLMMLKEDLEQDRKVIRIGNSIGITLPDKISKYGVNVGDRVRIEAIDEKTLKINIT